MFFWICNANGQLSDRNEGLVWSQCEISEINNIFPVKLKYIWVLLFSRIRTYIVLYVEAYAEI